MINQINTLRELIRYTKTFCFDADDTTADSFPLFVEYHNNKYDTSLKVSDFTTRRFHPILKCSPEEAIRRVDEFQHSSYFEKVMPIEGSVEAVTILHSQGKKLYIATARGHEVQDITERFYANYFAGLFQDIIHCVNGYSGQKNTGKTKADIVESLNATLIDDDANYTEPCGARGLYSILFGTCAWSQRVELPPFTLTAADYKEFLEAAV
jgi:5'(3')-deoxyribonucleotidase